MHWKIPACPQGTNKLSISSTVAGRQVKKTQSKKKKEKRERTDESCLTTFMWSSTLYARNINIEREKRWSRNKINLVHEWYVRICVYVCMCVYVCICICIYIYIYMYLFECLCVCVHIYTRMYKHIHQRKTACDDNSFIANYITLYIKHVLYT